MKTQRQKEFSTWVVVAVIFVLGMGLMIAQTPHNASLTFSDSLNPTGTRYNVYRGPGSCSSTVLTKITATPITSLNFVDNTITPPNRYCFAVTAVDIDGNESLFSNKSQLPPFAPNGLTISGN